MQVDADGDRRDDLEGKSPQELITQRTLLVGPMQAVQTGNVDMVRMLASNGATCSTTTHDGVDALGQAISQQRADIVGALCKVEKNDRGFVRCSLDKQRQSYFSRALGTGVIWPVVAPYLDLNDCHVAHGTDEDTLIHLTAKTCVNADAACDIFAKDSDAATYTNSKNETIGHLVAARADSTQSASALCILKAAIKTGRFDVNAQDQNGITPFALSALSLNRAFADELVATGQVDFDLQFEAFENHTAAEQLALMRQTAVAKDYMARQTRFDQRDTHNRTCAQNLVRLNDPDACEVLAVLLATSKGSAEETGLAHRDDGHDGVQTIYGLTALEQAVTARNMGAFELLVKDGRSDVNGCIGQSRTPIILHIAENRARCTNKLKTAQACLKELIRANKAAEETDEIMGAREAVQALEQESHEWNSMFVRLARKSYVYETRDQYSDDVLGGYVDLDAGDISAQRLNAKDKAEALQIAEEYHTSNLTKSVRYIGGLIGSLWSTSGKPVVDTYSSDSDDDSDSDSDDDSEFDVRVVNVPKPKGTGFAETLAQQRAAFNAGAAERRARRQSRRNAESDDAIPVPPPCPIADERRRAEKRFADEEQAPPPPPQRTTRGDDNAAANALRQAMADGGNTGDDQ